MAVVGLNFGALQAASIKAHPNLKLAVVCDLDAARAQAVGQKLSVPHSTSYESVLADPAIEAVALFTPPGLHAKHLTMAARAGKHVVVTKPFEISSARGEEAIRAAEEAGIVVMSNSPPPRYIGAYGSVKSAIDAGNLGKLVHISGHTWAFYDTMSPDGTWYDDPDACPGGPLFRLGIYSINFANVFLGRPAEVYAQQSWIRSKRPTPDHASLVVKYGSGAQLTLAVSLSVGGGVYPDNMLVAGTSGTLVINPDFSPSDSSERSLLLVQGRDRTRLAWPSETGGYDYEGLYRFIRGRETPEISIRAALDGVRVIEAARISLKEKRAVGL